MDFLEEVGDMLLVLLRVLCESVGMDGPLGDPHLLIAVDLGIVVPLEVAEGNEVVGIAVDKEHGTVAVGKLVERRSLPEAPAVPVPCDETCALEDIRRNEAEALLAVIVELRNYG